VQPRQTEVKDDEVELMRGQCRVGLGARIDPIHRIARRAQRAQQAVGQHLIIFGNQDAHGVVSSADVMCGGSPPGLRPLKPAQGGSLLAHAMSHPEPKISSSVGTNYCTNIQIDP